jgi:hypothetical protein
MLICDMADGCTVHRPKGGAPSIVLPPPGGSIPITKGQASDATIEELLRNGLISVHYTLSDSGSAYHRSYLTRHLKKSTSHS